MHFERLYGINKYNYEGVSKSFRTGRLERELKMVQISAIRCSWIAILWVSLVSFTAITLSVASQRVIAKVRVYFVIDSVRKLLDTPSYNAIIMSWCVNRNSHCCLIPASWNNPRSTMHLGAIYEVNKVKVKLSLCLTKHYVMKTYWRSGGIALHVLDLGTRWRWVVSFAPRPLYPQEKSPYWIGGGYEGKSKSNGTFKKSTFI
jgi:hypothetical protein